MLKRTALVLALLAAPAHAEDVMKPTAESVAKNAQDVFRQLKAGLYGELSACYKESADLQARLDAALAKKAEPKK